MGLFSKIFVKSSLSNSSEQEKKERLFQSERIRCDSNLDKDTLEMIYAALHEENSDTYDDFNMKDAVYTLDVNLYRLCKAIIYQNFMLQRKVEVLSDKIDRLVVQNGDNAHRPYV